jgi:hypothetical protein
MRDKGYAFRENHCKNETYFTIMNRGELFGSGTFVIKEKFLLKC